MFWFLLLACRVAPPANAEGPGCVADASSGAVCVETKAENVLGSPLARCGEGTGFFRDGTCRTDASDRGNHSVCAVMTTAFLESTRAAGNDLITPRPDLRFPGLTEGDRWCLCASRWEDARREGVAPGVVLESTAKAALRSTELTQLRSHAGR